MHVQYVMLNVWAFLITKQVREQKQMTDERVENQTRGTRLRFFPSEQRKRSRGAVRLCSQPFTLEKVGVGAPTGSWT